MTWKHANGAKFSTNMWIPNVFFRNSRFSMTKNVFKSLTFKNYINLTFDHNFGLFFGKKAGSPWLRVI
jgi:hypothetical protein